MIPLLLKRFASEPRQAVVFCSSSLMEHGVPLGVNEHRSPKPGPRKKSAKRLVGIDKYLQSRLPSRCEMHGICADGVVGENILLIIKIIHIILSTTI